MTAAASRNRYVTDNISTASPARLLIMLCNRLLVDVERGEAALRAGEREAAHRALVHAQDIILELRSTLDVDAWEGAPALDSLYSYIHGELIAANIERNPERVAACHALLEPLVSAWREAAVQVAGGQASVAASALRSTA